MDLIAKIEALFIRRGACAYDGERRESVSALEHALQCAQLAEWAHADQSLVAAALLATGFDPEVLEPIRLHVQAKRFLVSTDERYEQGLSPASRHSLALQGGRMRPEERLIFLAQPHASAALQLRRWDDLAKHPGKRTPPLGYYLCLLEDLLRQARRPARLVIA